jgi:antitoxin component YwqK of YwqJK toxin-antitoxin module
MRFFLALCVLFVGTYPASAEEEKESTGDPQAVYLEEPAVEPPAKIATRKKLEDKYEDGQLRLERNVALLSDETVVNDGNYLEYYPDGQKFCEGSYANGILSGEWSYWHPNGQLCKKITYQDGRPHGTVEIFRADGTLASKQSFDQGLRTGEWVSFHPDGKTIQAKMKLVAGKVEGERTTYYPNGQIRQQANFKGGAFDGPVAEFNEEGEKVASGKFEEGKFTADPPQSK